MPSVEVRPANQLQSHQYQTTQWIQLLNRFMDFLSMNMITATLPDYLSHFGGSEHAFYLCIGIQPVLVVVGTWILAAYIDGGPGRMLPAYLATSAVSVLGNVLYVSAGTVPALSSLWTLVVARGLVALGNSNGFLCLVYTAEVVTDDERAKWMIRGTMTRTQGLIWGPVIGVALAAVAAPGATSLFGYAVLPAWFQLVSRVVVTGLLWWTWVEPPDQAMQAGEAGNGAQGPSFGDFMRQRRVRVLCLVGGFTAMLITTQQALPLVVRNALGWTGAECGLPLAGQAILLTVGQVMARMLMKKGVEDRIVATLGCFCLTAACAASVLFWNLLDVHGGSAPPTMVVLGPFQVMAFLMPVANVGSFLTLTRLSVEDVPRHKAKLQGTLTTMQGVSAAASSAWLSVTYAGDRATRELVPQTCLACFVPFGIVIGSLMLGQLGALKPNSKASSLANEQGTPLLG